MTAGSFPVPGVSVTAARGDARVSTSTDDEGAFRFAGIDAGQWTLRVEMQGFETESLQVAVPSAQPVAIALRMRVTPEPATPLRAPAPAVRPAAPVDQINTEAIEGWIINGSVNNGAASDFAQSRAFGNNRQTGRAVYTGGFALGLGDSRVNASPFSFSGTNPAAPRSHDWQGAGTFGGPFKFPGLGNRGPQMFLAGQHAVSASAMTRAALMPTAAQRLGDFFGSPNTVRDPLTGQPFAGNRIPVSRISPIASALLAYYPLPQFEGDGVNYEAATTVETVQDAAQVRLTKVVHRTHVLQGAFAFRRSTTDSTSLFAFRNTSRASAFDGSFDWTNRRNARLAFHARYRVGVGTRNVKPFFADTVNVSGLAGLDGNDQTPGNWGPPRLQFPDVASLSDGNADWNRSIVQAELFETISTHGRHTITAGVETQQRSATVRSQQDGRGGFSFSGKSTGIALGDFLLGLPATASLAFGTGEKQLRGLAHSAYISDDWRPRESLTVNLGVRWDYEAPMTEASGRLANLDFNDDFSQSVRVVSGDRNGPLSPQTFPAPLIRSDWLGFQPRVAMSWRPNLASSLIIRTGYGLYRDAGLYQPLALMLAEQPPFAVAINTRTTTAAPLAIAGAFASTAATSINTAAVDPGLRTPVSHTWQGSVQYNLPGSMTGAMTYTGTRGDRLVQAVALNSPAPGAASNCAGCPIDVVYVSSGATSMRHALQIDLRRRLRNGFAANIQYQLANARTDAATLSVSAMTVSSLDIAENWRDPAAEMGPAAFDQRHAVTAQAQYSTRSSGSSTGWRRALDGWTMTSQTRVGSGLPFTPIYFAAVPGNGTVGLRPDLVGSLNRPAGSDAFADAAAFAIPAPGSWGNSGRRSIRGPWTWTVDGVISRTDRVSSRISLEWCLEATNVFNRRNVTAIDTVITSQRFGLPTIAATPRKLQLLSRVRF